MTKVKATFDDGSIYEGKILKLLYILKITELN